jgi:Outer membrane protein beta-barrel domain
MKKAIEVGLIIVMIFLYKFTFGQATYFDLEINGVSTNFNYGNSENELKDYKSPVKGFQAGVSFQAGITPHFSVVSELYFMQKGGELKTNNPLNKMETTIRLNTLETPLLARIHLGRLYLNAGPYLTYNISGTNKIENESKDVKFENVSDGFKRWETGVQMGGGYEFPLKNKRIAIDLRYNHGLTNISYGQEMYNRSFIVSVHFSKAWKTNPLGRN